MILLIAAVIGLAIGMLFRQYGPPINDLWLVGLLAVGVVVWVWTHCADRAAAKRQKEAEDDLR